jgi:hypothetical protein
LNPLHCGLYTAEAQMVRAGADFALAARADHVARAILVGTEERAVGVLPGASARVAVGKFTLASTRRIA